MMTLSAMSLRTEWMIEQIRRNAIDATFEAFKKAAKHYYETSEGGEEVTRLIHELEELGANYEVIIDTDLEIRDEVFG